ncbi:FmdE family protein [Candidatus Contubernalis alkaliaceticus]|uniref:FmdE family protein n=1 Tax=Candidatus Contubernalis alkaliaceticus TaxID=338645 RepID=UPI001F4C191E|nr:FmdE family protein [Candidatus Contubernalis alkalaceticus]UNC93001.1 TraR/DksA C4-type zinc finger protein [Candidatus Contubernalis alkalaceticus]
MCMEKTPWEKAVEFHGHVCPGLAYGYRAAMEYLKRMEAGPSKDEEVVAIVETDNCGVDAIQVLTSCTFGKGNLIFKDYGKNVFTFASRDTQEGLRISLKHGAMEKVAPEGWKELREKLFSGGEVKEEERQLFKKHHAELTQIILNVPVEEIFEIKTVKVDLPFKAKLFDSVQCGFCGEGIMEPRARVKEGKFACPECFEGYRSRVN